MRITPRQEIIEVKRTSPWWWRVPVIIITIGIISILLTIVRVASADYAGDLGMLIEASLKAFEMVLDHLFRIIELVWRG